MKTESDLIGALGYLCLGSRLKRLGERMQAGVGQMLAQRGEAVQPAQLPILMALQLDGAMTVSALGERVGISQPGVSRAIAALESLGMVASLPGGRDRRLRRIAMTPRATALMTSLAQTLFPAVDDAVAQLCARDGLDFLAELDRIEDGLAREPLDARIRRAASRQQHG